MPRNYLPGSDSGLLNWSVNFSFHVLADAAGPGDFGVTPDEANAYAVTQAAYGDAYRRANAPETRGPASVMVKNERRRELVAATRRLAMFITARQNVTNGQRVGLGLNAAKPKRRRHVPRPRVAPLLDVWATHGRRVTLKLRNAANPGRRGRPVDVSRATVLRYIGASPPTKVSKWTLVTDTCRTTLTVQAPGALQPGEAVWFTAAWQNWRGEAGPYAEPVRAREDDAAAERTSLRLAA